MMNNTTENVQFVAYYRVSIQKQNTVSYGIEAQKLAVSDYIAGKGCLIADFTEIESGSNSERPRLNLALEYCKKHDAMLIIAKLDRLARNVHFISGLINSGIHFICCDSPNASKLELHIKAVFAEEERDNISRRTKAALAVAKKRGVNLGSPNPSIGAKHSAEARKEKAEKFARIVLPVIEKISNSGKSYRQIATQLNEMGLSTATGRKWKGNSVWYLVSTYG